MNHGWCWKYFCGHIPSVVEEEVEVVGPDPIIELGPVQIYEGHASQYNDVFQNWRKFKITIKSDGAMMIGPDEYQLNMFDWHKIKIGKDAYRNAIGRPEHFTNGRNDKSLVAIPQDEGQPSIYLSFENPFKLVKFIESVMKAMNCMDPNVFFEEPGSLEYYNELLKERTRFLNTAV